MRRILTVALLLASVLLSAASLGIVFGRDDDGDAPVKTIAIDDICGLAYQDPLSSTSRCYDLRCDGTLTEMTTAPDGTSTSLEGTYQVYSEAGENRMSVSFSGEGADWDKVLQTAEAGIYLDGEYYRSRDSCE